MKKELRMLAGIILHPVKMVVFRLRRIDENYKLIQNARQRQWSKNHERMHDMSRLTGTAYTSSELYNDLYHGAPNYR